MHTKQIKKQSLYKTGLSISTHILYHFTIHSHLHENQVRKKRIIAQVKTVNISVIVNIKKKHFCVENDK